ASCAAGIRYEGREDMAMVFTHSPAVSAGTYTTNVVKAAPVVWDRNITDNDHAVYAVVVNSGIANACTGAEGDDACRRTAEAAAAALSAKRGVEASAENIILASTGVIGEKLPVEKFIAGSEEMAGCLDSSREAANRVARAIMTTDTVEKEVAVEFEVGGKTVTLGGMSKGSGMIHPNMCTMLAFLTTDVAISKELLLKALREDVKDTFNMISVDGDTSTNDSLVILANGESGAPLIDSEGPDYDAFREALNFVNTTLAMKMAGDGEGATALFEVKVTGADTKENARTLAKSVITSSLTKAAIFGHDANWGRILCALGYSGVEFDPVKVTLDFESANGKIRIAQDGSGVNFSEEKATEILSCEKVTALVDMNTGDESATAWGCDLTYDYVKINADYRS
ncbi:MAG: bifunctional glutamate N-acetyltransferase/amino-acid acetyltransferase ArgJ, partial [Eubacterium sp.]|nr:bifunctional glutamate N-acetyltransferase/amino-acid acetyltransferase ArgJ [Eubacterium sp.]